MSALKEHLNAGTLDQRLDTLLTDAAAKVMYCTAEERFAHVYTRLLFSTD